MIPGSKVLPFESVKEWHDENDEKAPRYLRALQSAAKMHQARRRLIWMSACSVGVGVGYWLPFAIWTVVMMSLLGTSVVLAIVAIRNNIIARRISEEMDQGIKIVEPMNPNKLYPQRRTA